MSGDLHRGEIWWAELGKPRGSGPGFRHPVLVVQSDAFNRSRINSVVAAVVSSSLSLAGAPGNVRLSRRQSRLPRASVVNVSQIVTIDRRYLTRRVGRIPHSTMTQVDRGLGLVLGLVGAVGGG